MRTLHHLFLLDFEGVFLSVVCAKSEAATLLTIAGVFGLRSNFEASEATFFDVSFLLAITKYFIKSLTRQMYKKITVCAKKHSDL